MSRPLLPGVAAMAVIVVASNILVQFLVGDWLTWGAFTYPFAFLVTDLMNRLHGPAAARRVVAGGLRRRAALQLRRQPDRGAVRAAGQPAGGDRLGDGVPGRAAPRRRGLQPAAGGELVAGAVRLERAGQRGRHRDLLRARLLGGARLHRAAGRRRPGRTRRCRCSAAGRRRRSGCRSRLPISWSSSRIAVFALAPFRAALGLAYAQRALRLGLPFARGAATSGQPKPAKGGDPMSSETLEREAGFTRGGTA